MAVTAYAMNSLAPAAVDAIMNHLRIQPNS